MWETQKERETVCPVQIGHQKAVAMQARSVTPMMRQMPSVRICHVGAIVHFDSTPHGWRRLAVCDASSSEDAGVSVLDDVDRSG